MKKSKWNSKRLSHYRPIKECKNLDKTYGEVCLECNECGRFNKKEVNNEDISTEN